MFLDGAKLICLNDVAAGDAPQQGETVPAQGKTFKFGYYMDCDVVLENPNALGLQCTIDCDAFGRVTIENLCPEEPITLDGKVLKKTRPLLHNTEIGIFDKKYLWHFEGSCQSAAFQMEDADDYTTPCKQLKKAKQPPHSEPARRWRTQFQKRLTIHNIVHYHIKPGESPQDVVAITDENKPLNSFERIIDAEAPGEPSKRLSPPPQPVAADLIDLKTPKVRQRSLVARKTPLSSCKLSETVITSYSPRETGVRPEKSFAIVQSLTVTPAKTSTTLPDITLGPFQQSSSPSTKNHRSSMHLIDLTTPMKRIPLPSPLLLKSTLKKNTTLTKQQPASLTPVANSSSSSVFSVHSTDDESVIELSDDGGFSSSPVLKTPTRLKTPQSLMKRAILGSAKKAAIIKRLQQPGPGPAPPPPDLTTPKNPASASKVRFQSRSTPPRKSLCGRLQLSGQSAKASQSVLSKVGKSMVTSTPFRARTSTSTGFRRSSILPSPPTDPRSKSRTSLMLKHALSGSPHSSVLLKRKSLALLRKSPSKVNQTDSMLGKSQTQNEDVAAPAVNDTTFSPQKERIQDEQIDEENVGKEDVGVGVPTITISDIDPDPATDAQQHSGIPTITISDIETPAASAPESKGNSTPALKESNDVVKQSTSKHQLNVTFSPEKRQADEPDFPQTPQSSRSFSKINAEKAYPSPDLRANMELMDDDDFEGLDAIFKTPKARNLMILSSPKSISLQKPSSDSVELIQSTEYDLSPSLDDIFQTPQSELMNNRTEGGTTPADAEALGPYSSEEAFDMMVGRPINKRSYARKPTPRKEELIPLKAPRDESLPKTDIEEWIDNVNESIETLDGEKEEEDEMSYLTANQSELSRDPLMTSSITGSAQKTKQKKAFKAPNDESAMTIQEDDEEECGENASALKDPLEMTVPSPKKTLSPNISGIDLLDHTSESLFSETLAVSDDSSGKDAEKSIEQTANEESIVCVEEDLAISPDKARLELEQAFENFEKERKVVEGKRLISTPEPQKRVSKLASRRTMGNEPTLSTLFDLNALKEEREMEMAFEKFEEQPAFSEQRLAQTPEPKKPSLKDHRRTMGSGAMTGVKLDIEAAKAEHEMRMAFENFEEEPEFTGERAVQTPEPKKQLSKDHRRTCGSTLVAEVKLDLEAAKAQREMELAFENFEEEPEFAAERTVQTPEPKRPLSKDHRRTVGSSLVCEVQLDLQAAKAERELKMAFENFDEEPDFATERTAKTPEPKKMQSKDRRRTVGSNLVSELTLDLEAAKARREMELAFENFEEEPEFSQERAAQTPDLKKAATKDHRRTMGSSLVTEVNLDLADAKARREMELAFQNFEEEPEFAEERVAKTPEPKKEPLKDHRRTMGSSLVSTVTLDLEALKEQREMELAFENFLEKPEFAEERAAKTPEPKKQLSKDHRRTIGSGLVSEVTIDLEAAKAERDMELAFENFEEEPEFVEERAAKTPEPKKQLSKDHRRTMGSGLVSEVTLDLEAAKAERDMELAFENFEEEPEFAEERAAKTPEPKKQILKDHRRTVGSKSVTEVKLDLEAAKAKRELELAFENFEEEPEFTEERAAKTPEPKKQLSKDHRRTLGSELVSEVTVDLEAAKAERDMELAFENFEEEPEFAEERSAKTPEPKKQLSKDQRRTMGSGLVSEVTLDLEAAKAERDMELAFENFEEEPEFAEERAAKTPEPKKQLSKDHRRTMGSGLVSEVTLDLEAAKAERDMELAFENFEEEPEFAEERAAKTPEPKKQILKDHRRTVGSKSVTEVKLDLGAAKAKRELELAFENFEEEPEFTEERAAKTPEPKKQLSKDHRRTLGSELVSEVTLDLEAAKAERDMELAFENFEEEPEFAEERPAKTPEPKKQLSQDHRRTMGSNLVTEVKLDLEAAKAQREMELAFENFEEEPDFAAERAVQTPEPKKLSQPDHRRTMGTSFIPENKLDVKTAKIEHELDLIFGNFIDEPRVGVERLAKTPDPRRTEQARRMSMGYEVDVLKGSLEPFSLKLKLKNESEDHYSDEDLKNEFGEKHQDKATQNMPDEINKEESLASKNDTDASKKPQTLMVNKTNGSKQSAVQKNDKTSTTPCKTLRQRRQNSVDSSSSVKDLQLADDNKEDDKKNGGSASQALRIRRKNSASDDEATKSIRLDSTDVDSTEDEGKLSTTGRRKRLRKKGALVPIAETIGEVQHPLEPIAEEERRQSTQLVEQDPENKEALQEEAPAKSVLSLKADVDEVICSSPSSSLSHTRGRRVQLSVVLKQSNDVTSTTSETEKVHAAEENDESTHNEAEVRISDETFAEEVDIQAETTDAAEEIPSTPAPTKVRSRRPSRRAASTDTTGAPAGPRRGSTQQDTEAKAEEVGQKVEVMASLAVQSDQPASYQLNANVLAKDSVSSTPVPSEEQTTPAVRRGRREGGQQDTTSGVEKVIFSTAAPRRGRRGSVQLDLDEFISKPLHAEVEAAPAACRGRRGSVQQDLEADAANDVDPSLLLSESARALPIRRGRRGSAQQEVSTPAASDSTTLSTVRRGRRGSVQQDDAEDVVLSTPLPTGSSITRRGRRGSAQQDTTIEADVIASTPSQLNAGSAVRRGRRASVQEDLVIDADEVIPPTPLPSEHTAASAVRRGRRGSAKQDTEVGAEKMVQTTPLQAGLNSTPSRRRNRRGSAQNDTESDGDDSVFSTALPSGKLDRKALQIEAIAENSDEAEEETAPTPKVKPETMEVVATSELATTQETCETKMEHQAKLEKQEAAPAEEGLVQEEREEEVIPQNSHTTSGEASVQDSSESTELTKKAELTEQDKQAAAGPAKSDDGMVENTTDIEVPRSDNDQEITSTSENLLQESTKNPSIEKDAEQDPAEISLKANLVEPVTEQDKNVEDLTEDPAAPNDNEEINLEQTISDEREHSAEGRAMTANEVDLNSPATNGAPGDATEPTGPTVQEEQIESLEAVEPLAKTEASNAAETSDASKTGRGGPRAAQKAEEKMIAKDLTEAIDATNDVEGITLEQKTSNANETEDLVESQAKNADEVEAVSSEKNATSGGDGVPLVPAGIIDANEVTLASETLASRSVAKPSAEEGRKKEVDAEIEETIVSAPQKTRGRKARLVSDGSKSSETLSKTRGRRAASRSESTESVEESTKLNTRTQVSDEVTSETLVLVSIEESPTQEESEQTVETDIVKATDLAQVDVAEEPSKAESTEKDAAEALVTAGNGHGTIPTTETLNEIDDKVVKVAQKTRGRKRRNTAASTDGSTSDAAESTEIPTKSRGRRAALKPDVIVEVSEVITEHETLAENSPEEQEAQETVEHVLPETKEVAEEPSADDALGIVVAPETEVEKSFTETQNQEDVEGKTVESVLMPQKSRGRKRKASAAETLVPDVVEPVQVQLKSRGRRAESKLQSAEKDVATVVEHPDKDVEEDTDFTQETHAHEANPSESVDTNAQATSKARGRKPALKTKPADTVDESSAKEADEQTPEEEVVSKTDAELSAPPQKGRGRRAKNLEQSSTQESKPTAVTGRSRGRGKHQESEPTATEDLHFEPAVEEVLPVVDPTVVSSAEEDTKQSSEVEKTDDEVIVPSVPVVATKSRGRKAIVKTSAVGLTPPDTEESAKTRGRGAPAESVAEQSDVEVAKTDEKVVQPRKRRGRAGVSVDEQAEEAAGGDEKAVQPKRRRGRAASRTDASESVDVTKDEHREAPTKDCQEDHQGANEAAPTTKDSSSGADAEADVPSAQVPATKPRGRRGAAKLNATEPTVTAAPRRKRRGTVDHELADESESVSTTEHDRLVAIKSETAEALESSTPIRKRGRRGAVEEAPQVHIEDEPKKRRGRAASKSEAAEPVNATKETSENDADSEHGASADKHGRLAAVKIEPVESTAKSSATRGRRGVAKQHHDTDASHADTEEAPPPKKRGRHATVKQELVESEVESSHDHDHDADVEDEEAPSKKRGRVAATKKDAIETPTPSLKRGRRGIVHEETPQTGTTEAPRARGGRQAKAKLEHANETSTPVTKRGKKPDSTNEESTSQEQSSKEALSTSASKEESEQSTEPEKKPTRGRRAMSTSSPPKEDAEKSQKKPVRGRRAQTAKKDTTIDSTSHTEEEHPAAKPTRGRKQPANPDTSSAQEPAPAVVTKARGRGRAKVLEVEEPKAPSDEEIDDKPAGTEQPNKKTTRGRKAAQPKPEAESTPQVTRVRKQAASTAPKDSDDEQPETSKRSARSKETSDDATKEEKLRKPTRANRRHLELAAEDSDLDTPSKRVRRKAKILLSDEFVT